MADLATGLPAEGLRLARTKRREVVVQQEAAMDITVHGVESLGVSLGAEGGRHERLGLSALEDGRTMRALVGARLHEDGSDLIERATVDADVGVDHLGPNQSLLEVAQRRLDLFDPIGVRVAEGRRALFS